MLRVFHRARRERGAAALMVAMSLTLLLLAAAMVLDFGLIRFDKQANKSAADAAVIAGARSTSATVRHGPGGVFVPPSPISRPTTPSWRP